jgi:hypothetical protein
MHVHDEQHGCGDGELLGDTANVRIDLDGSLKRR